ncbi:MAG: VOC family protein [Acidobacteria bacterium]|nr:VOC family protein [Acidobacteriota bacterium]
MPAAPLGHFCWPELFTSDLIAARAFYTGLLGWAWCEVPSAGGRYALAMLEEDPVAGAFQAPTPLGLPRWNSYVRVAQADEAAGRAKALGGRVMAGPYDVPEVGRMAWIADPETGFTGPGGAADNRRT